MWMWLAVGIVSEVVATLSLRSSEGFSRVGPSVVVVLGYALAFYALSQSLVRGMQIGHAYAIWAGIGVAVVAVLGTVLFGEHLSAAQFGGLALVIAGIVILELGASHG